MSDIREAAFSHDLERLKYFVEVVGVDVNDPNVHSIGPAAATICLERNTSLRKLAAKNGQLPIEFAKSDQMRSLLASPSHSALLSSVAVPSLENDQPTRYGLEAIHRIPLQVELQAKYGGPKSEPAEIKAELNSTKEGDEPDLHFEQGPRRGSSGHTRDVNWRDYTSPAPTLASSELTNSLIALQSKNETSWLRSMAERQQATIETLTKLLLEKEQK